MHILKGKFNSWPFFRCFFWPVNCTTRPLIYIPNGSKIFITRDFCIKEFYPSIKETLLNEAIQFANGEP